MESLLRDVILFLGGLIVGIAMGVLLMVVLGVVGLGQCP